MLALFISAALVVVWGAFTALLSETALGGVTVVCLTVAFVVICAGKAANALGGRLAAATAYVDLPLLQSMKSHLLDRCGDVAPNHFFKPVSFRC